MEVQETEKTDVTSAETYIATNSPTLHVSDYLQAELFMKIELVEDADILQRDIILSHANNLLEIFHTYRFDHFHGAPLCGLSPSTERRICSYGFDRAEKGLCQVLNTVAKVLSLDLRRCLEEVQ